MVEPTRFDGSACLQTDLDYLRAPLFRLRSEVRPRASAAGVERSRFARRPAHSVSAGALVLGSVAVRGQRCTYVAQPGGVESGVISDRHLVRVDDPPADASMLLGDWVEGPVLAAGLPRAHVSVVRTATGELHLRGAAYYYRDDEEARAPFDSSFDGALTFDEDRAEGRGPDGCRLVVRPRGPFLIVNDNRECGFPDASFAGVYVREAPATGS